MKSKKPPRYQAVRLAPDDFEKVEQLRDIVARSGWVAIGSVRTTPVTLGTVAAEAVTQALAAASKKRA